jgi:hypothetical protein
MPHTTAQRTYAVRSGALAPGDCYRAYPSITVERTP